MLSIFKQKFQSECSNLSIPICKTLSIPVLSVVDYARDRRHCITTAPPNLFLLPLSSSLTVSRSLALHRVQSLFSSFLLVKLQLRFRRISFNWLRCALPPNPYFCLSILLTAPEHNHHFTSSIWPTSAIPIPTEPVRYVFRFKYIILVI